MSLFSDYYKSILQLLEKAKLKNSQNQTSKSSSIDENLFRHCLQQHNIISELFLPAGYAVWEEGRFSLKKDKEKIAQASTKISGVRFQAADPKGENLEPERQCQQDVVNLVKSLIQLRKTSAFSHIVLSNEILKNPQPISQLGTRVKFGLCVAPKFANEIKATAESHRNIVRAIRQSGFVVEFPETFDSKTGMAGLLQWASELKLRRRKIPRWLLLLPLLLFLLFSLRNCEPPSIFVPIETQSFIILLDKSGSMSQHFSVVQAEAEKTLKRMSSSFFSTYYADIIAYDSVANSALGKIEEVNDETVSQLTEFLSKLQAGGGTFLRSGIDLAAQEVAAHRKPTTLIILTDGGDGSIAQMLQNKEAILNQFQGIEIIGNTLTPRVFNIENPKPIDGYETQLSELATMLNGKFGKVK